MASSSKRLSNSDRVSSESLSHTKIGNVTKITVSSTKNTIPGVLTRTARPRVEDSSVATCHDTLDQL
ncbi:hypothetical protein PCANC_00973 [Puccinia coronata f. sp. avenae]|nr:hypothetical protein PCANC_03995 [Puccinia coronata f. sp. avenae]PLW57863.1 hypothetical protein PCANC_00973 [Puccinia coronata f. sp. avenae]